jgi:hypothetical protein
MSGEGAEYHLGNQPRQERRRPEGKWIIKETRPYLPYPTLIPHSLIHSFTHLIPWLRSADRSPHWQHYASAGLHDRSTLPLAYVLRLAVLHSYVYVYGV